MTSGALRVCCEYIREISQRAPSDPFVIQAEKYEIRQRDVVFLECSFCNSSREIRDTSERCRVP
jgi:hypothetical protein